MKLKNKTWGSVITGVTLLSGGLLSAPLACSEPAVDSKYFENFDSKEQHDVVSAVRPHQVSCNDAAPDSGMVCCAGIWAYDHADTQRLAKLNAEGHLVYSCYKNQPSRLSTSELGQADTVLNIGNIIPDFSHAGYMGGGVALPNTSSCSCGTLTEPDNDSTDDTARIQSAIDACSVPGGGVVCLGPGTFEINATIVITADNVVLRGAGQSRMGTTLHSYIPGAHSLIQVGDSRNFSQVSGSTRWDLAADVGVGQTAVSVDVSASSSGCAGFAAEILPNAWVMIRRTPNSKWVTDVGGDSLASPWTPSGYIGTSPRKVTSVSCDSQSGIGTIEFEVPMVEAIYGQYGGGRVESLKNNSYTEGAGVEKLRLYSEYTDDVPNGPGWDGIKVVASRDSWVRQVTVRRYSNSAVTIGESFNVTVEEVAHIDPVSPWELYDHDKNENTPKIWRPSSGHRYAFSVGTNSWGILFQRCFARDSRHAFVSGAQLPGPAVWLDSVTLDAWAGSGPHQRWATGLLLDNVEAVNQRPWTGVGLEARYSKGGTGHGWRGAQVMYWNSAVAEMKSHSPPGAKNWVVGGIVASGQNLDVGSPYAAGGNRAIWELSSTTVTPRSLYLQQLEDRLGSAAVAAVTLNRQRSGRITQALIEWAGDGNLADYVDAVYERDSACDGMLAGSGSSVCCEHNCRQCGGSGCGTGGVADECCTGNILAARSSCRHNPGPCVMPDPKCTLGDISGDLCCVSGQACPSQVTESCYDFPAPCVIPAGDCVGNQVNQGGKTYCCEGMSSTSCVAEVEFVRFGGDERLCEDNPSPCLMADPDCSDGVVGLGEEGETVCCKSECDFCGGPGCSGAGSGCCSGSIISAGASCDERIASCLVN